MSWNYRVVKENTECGTYRIVEMYYNSEDEPENYCEPFYEQETFGDLRHTHELIQEAFQKPVILLDAQGNFIRD